MTRQNLVHIIQFTSFGFILGDMLQQKRFSCSAIQPLGPRVNTLLPSCGIESPTQEKSTFGSTLNNTQVDQPWQAIT